MSVTADKLVDAAGLLDVLKSVLGGGVLRDSRDVRVRAVQSRKQ